LGLVVEREAWGTILGILGDTKFSLFYYKYPLLYPTIEFDGIHLAEIRDIGAMKIDAIASRGTKRDFTDLYFIVKKCGRLKDLLSVYDQRYKKLETNKVYIIKSLTYFVDADKEEDPRMLVRDYNWQAVKKYLIEEAEKLV